MSQGKTTYALDIETDGLVEPLPTSIVLYDGENARMAVRTSESGGEPDRVELSATLHERFEPHGVTIDSITVNESWEGMANAISGLIGSTVGDTETVATYRGLGYRGGFDIPALDFAFHKVGMQNPLVGHFHTDVYDVVNRGYIYNTVPQFPSRGGPSKSDMRGAAEMFELEDEASGLNKAPLADLLNENLTVEQIEEWADEYGYDVPTTDVETLDEVYEYLYDDDLPDPFNGEGAPEAWRAGEYADLLTHNISDVVKTHRLYQYIENSAIPRKRYDPDRLG